MKILYFLLISAASVSSCTVLPSYQSTSIDLGFYPSDIKIGFSDSIRELVRINRVPVDSVSSSGKLYYVLGKKVIDAFSEEINKRQFYSFVNQIVNYPTSNTGNFSKQILPDTLVKITKGKYGVVALEYLKLEAFDSFKNEIDKVYGSNNEVLREDNIVVGRRKIIATTGWRIYDINGKVLNEVELNDSYFYEVKAENEVKASRRLEAKKQLEYLNVINSLGFEYAEKISTFRATINRNFYIRSTTSKVLEEAISFVENEDWEGAKNVWLETLNLDLYKRDLAKVYYNLGVYYEKNKNIEKAIEMLSESKALDSEVGSKYLEALENVRRNGYF